VLKRDARVPTATDDKPLVLNRSRGFSIEVSMARHNKMQPNQILPRIMRKPTALMVSLAITATLLACSQRSRTVIGGPDAQEAAIRLEESHQEYDNCIASRQAGGPTCDSLKALYEKDKAEYESQVN
jgi:hypothetical protein